MADQRPRIPQPVSDRLTIERSVTVDPFELSAKEVGELELLVHEFIKLDKTIATLEERRAVLKEKILKMFGKNAQHLIGLILGYGRKKRRVIRFWFNRHEYDIAKLHERLKGRPQIFKATVSEGTALRVVVPASPMSRSLVIDRTEKKLRQALPGAVVTAYRGGPLEQIVKEDELIRRAERAGISLNGTRHSVINTRVYDL